MITVAKERIGVAIELLEQTTHTDERVQLVGLIDLARDELSKALKEAKERAGMGRSKEIKGQKQLPLDKPARKSRAPKNAVGVDEKTGMVITKGDVAEMVAAEQEKDANDGRCEIAINGDRCHLPAGHEGGHSWGDTIQADHESNATPVATTNPDRCGYIDPITNNRCIAAAFHDGAHTFLQTFSQRENLPEKEPTAEPVL